MPAGVRPRRGHVPEDYDALTIALRSAYGLPQAKISCREFLWAGGMCCWAARCDRSGIRGPLISLTEFIHRFSMLAANTDHIVDLLEFSGAEASDVLVPGVRPGNLSDQFVDEVLRRTDDDGISLQGAAIAQREGQADRHDDSCVRRLVFGADCYNEPAGLAGIDLEVDPGRSLFPHALLEKLATRDFERVFRSDTNPTRSLLKAAQYVLALDDRCGYLIDRRDGPTVILKGDVDRRYSDITQGPVALRLAVRAKFDCRHIYGFVEGDRRDAQPALG